MEYMIQEDTLIEIADAVRSKFKYKDLATSLICNKERFVNVDIPDGTTKIRHGAFEGCYNLISINIPESVMDIEEMALNFSSEYSLENITVSENNNYYSSEDGVLFNKYKTTLIAHPLSNIRTSYVVPTTVTCIGTFAFYFCDNLTNITLPNGLIDIKYLAFWGCTNLKTITIPDSVTSIGNNVFTYCHNLTDMYLYPSTPPTLQSANAISDATTIIHVPVGSGDAYKSATNWSSFADIIVEDIVIE